MYGGPSFTELRVKNVQSGADVFGKGECEGGSGTVTNARVEAGSREEQEQGMRGSPHILNKCLTRTVTKGKVEGEGREQQGMRGGSSKDEYVAQGSTNTKGKVTLIDFLID